MSFAVLTALDGVKGPLLACFILISSQALLMRKGLLCEKAYGF